MNIVASRLFHWLSRRRIPLAFLAGGLLLIEDLSEGVIPHDLDGLLDGRADIIGTMGLFIVLSGCLLRAWAAGVITKASRVCREGPYAIVRHPLYVGSLLIAIGACIIIDDGIENIMVVAIFASCIYIPKMRREESEMLGKFGEEYARYMVEKPAIFPWRVPATIDLSWDFRKFLSHREYRTSLAALSCLALAEVWHHILIP